jgi:hypothetical protein
MKQSALIVGAAVGIVAVTGCASGATPSTLGAASASGLASPSENASENAATNACENRPQTGQILVWYKDPGIADSAQELGGQWRIVAGRCVDSMDWVIATSPTGPGDCTEVKWASSQPDYNTNADPAPPLKDVVEEVGPAC